jgi:predicted dithiol-disulfide oxidoreductase (DUF899 family)
MTDHKIGTREEWLAARLELLKAEKALTRRSDELAQWRQRLPWVRIDKEYRFETDEGMASLADLFRGHSQLLIYHFMFGPEYTGGCPACSTIADGFNGFAVHLEHHDVAMIAVSRAPIVALQAYKRRMGWTFTWASSLNSDFNYDFNTSFTEEQQRSGSIDYNYRTLGMTSDSEALSTGEFAAMTGTDVPTYTRAGHERVRTLRRRHLSHILHLRARPRRALGNVPVARPGAEWAKRNGAVVSAARRVHTRFSIAVASIFGSQGADALIVTN